MRVVVTGAGRGLGLEFSRRYLQAGDRVFALARAPEASKALQELKAASQGHLICVACDVGDDASVKGALGQVAAATDGVELLLNNAGTYGSDDDRLAGLDFAEVRRVFEINTIGPMRVSRESLPLLRMGTNPKIVHISSLMGSVEDNRSGGKWSYRLSKAALNMAGRNLAVELEKDGIISVVFHPGWVKTDMGGAGAPLSVGEAVGAMIETIGRLTQKHSGQFLDRHGKPAPY